MSASKPTKLPRWASGTTAQITEPNEGKKDLGHVVAEHPPAQYFNWLFNLIYGWLSWLNNFEAVAHTWTALQTFAGGIAGNLAIDGNLSVTGEVDHSKSLKSAAPISGSDPKLVSEHPGYGAGAGSVRRYALGAGSSLALVETINAYWGIGSAWARDVADQPSFMIKLGVAGARAMAWPVGDATPFARELKTTEAGLKWSGVGAAAADANPPATTGITNELRAANTCKAWGSFEFKGTAAPKEFNTKGGFNVSGLVNATNGRFGVNFASPMADANYAPIITSKYGLYTTKIMAVEPTGFSFEVWTTDGVTQITPSSAEDAIFYVHVFGNQAS